MDSLYTLSTVVTIGHILRQQKRRFLSIRRLPHGYSAASQLRPANPPELLGLVGAKAPPSLSAALGSKICGFSCLWAGLRFAEDFCGNLPGAHLTERMIFLRSASKSPDSPRMSPNLIRRAVLQTNGNKASCSSLRKDGLFLLHSRNIMGSNHEINRIKGWI